MTVWIGVYSAGGNLASVSNGMFSKPATNAVRTKSVTVAVLGSRAEGSRGRLGNAGFHYKASHV